jgi:hypothetical protein
MQADANEGGDDSKQAFLRSPFFGVFRVGTANLVLINVHLASDEKLSRESGCWGRVPGMVSMLRTLC